MNWRSHALIGALSGLIIAFALGEGFAQSLVMAAFAGLSALAPDLDHDSSRGRKWLDVAFVCLAAMIVLGSACGAKPCVPGFSSIGGMVVTFLAMAGVYFLFFRFLKPRHRGITHTLAACFAFALLVFFMADKTLALAGLAGYLSHLAADNELKAV